MNHFSGRQKAWTLFLKAVVLFSAVIGVILSAYGGRNSFMGGRTVFMYFTIQSNIAIALICAIGAYRIWSGREIRNNWYLIKFVGTISITLTGAVFCFVLAPTMGVYAWNLQNILTHVVVPVAAVADFFVTGINGNIKNKEIGYIVLPPIAYVIYAGIGYLCNWQFGAGVNYPYFFLNWGSPAGAFGFSNELPFMGCVWWILALSALLLLVSWGYLLLVRALQKKFRPQLRNS